MEVSETEFHGLKQEQQILVDFHTFPSKLVELMELCIRKTEEAPKFLTSLMSTTQYQGTCDAILSIIETNQFKHLTHLSLKLKSGNDEMIKKYLAAKLREFRQENEDLIQRLKSKEDLLAVRTQELDTLQIQANKLHESKEQIVELQKMEEQRKLTELKERMLDTYTQQIKELEKEKKFIQENLESRVRELQSKVDQLSQQVVELSQKKNELEHSERNLKNQVDSQSHQLEMLDSELQHLRKNNKNLDSHKYTQEKNLTELQLKNESLKRSIQDKEDQIQNLNQLVLTNQQSKAQLEETLNMLKASNKKMEEKFSISTQEILKGNQIIKQLDAKVKEYKQKIKMNNQVVLKQENIIQQKQEEIDLVSKSVQQTKRENNSKDSTIKSLEITIEDYKNQLQQSQEKVEEKEKMNQWLNKQLSEAQKAGGIAKYATQGAYKPSTLGSNPSIAVPTSFKPSNYSLEQLRMTNQPGNLPILQNQQGITTNNPLSGGPSISSNYSIASQNLVTKNLSNLPSQTSSAVKNYQQQIQNPLERNQQIGYTPSSYIIQNQPQNQGLYYTPVRQGSSQQTSIVQSEQSQYGEMPPLDLIVPIKYKEPNK